VRVPSHVFLVCCLLGFTSAIAQTAALSPGSGRGPSTPEERKRVVTITRKLEAAPLDQTLYQERDWARQWLLEIHPDVHIKSCNALLVELRRPRYKYFGELLAQLRLASAVFLIEHPDKNGDHFGESLAGMESVLKAYSSLIKPDKDNQTAPDVRSKPLDDLLEQQRKGKLPDFVRDRISVCTF
jgi:hypothetical protein